MFWHERIIQILSGAFLGLRDEVGLIAAPEQCIWRSSMDSSTSSPLAPPTYFATSTASTRDWLVHTLRRRDWASSCGRRSRLDYSVCPFPRSCRSIPAELLPDVVYRKLKERYGGEGKVRSPSPPSPSSSPSLTLFAAGIPSPHDDPSLPHASPRHPSLRMGRPKPSPLDRRRHRRASLLLSLRPRSSRLMRQMFFVAASLIGTFQCITTYLIDVRPPFHLASGR